MAVMQSWLFSASAAQLLLWLVHLIEIEVPVLELVVRVHAQSLPSLFPEVVVAAAAEVVS